MAVAGDGACDSVIVSPRDVSCSTSRPRRRSAPARRAKKAQCYLSARERWIPALAEVDAASTSQHVQAV